MDMHNLTGREIDAKIKSMTAPEIEAMLERRVETQRIIRNSKGQFEKVLDVVETRPEPTITPFATGVSVYGVGFCAFMVGFIIGLFTH